MKTLSKIVLAASLALGAQAASAASVNLIDNGDFETGDMSSWSLAAAATGYASTDNPAAGAYSASLYLDHPNANVMQQVIAGGTIANGSEITFSFDARGSIGSTGAFQFSHLKVV